MNQQQTESKVCSQNLCRGAKEKNKRSAVKKLFIALSAAALLGTPAAALAQNTSTATYFAGERITGVEASSAFDVVLVKDNQTKAVVEINRKLESHVKISRGSDGVVSIGLREMSGRLWREFNRLPDKERIIRLTLHLPGINTIRLSGASDLLSRDSFSGDNVDIQLSGASEIEGDLNISASRVKIQCSGASEASFNLPATKELVVVSSGASELDITARGLAYSKIVISGASDVELEGDGERGDWTVSGASELSAERFVAREVSITSSGASSARVNASKTLTTRASGASSVRYAGNPSEINNLQDMVKPM